jgi:hypothetical protein
VIAPAVPFVRLLVPVRFVLELRPDVGDIAEEQELALELVGELPGGIDRELPDIPRQQIA